MIAENVHSVNLSYRTVVRAMSPRVDVGSPYGIGLRFGDPALRLLLAIRDLEHNERRPATYADLMTATGCARATLRRRLCKLRDLGLVEWTPGRTGTIRAVV